MLSDDLSTEEARELLDGVRDLRTSLKALAPPKSTFLQTWGPTILGCIISGLIAIGTMRERLVSVENKNAEQDRQIERIDQLAGKAITDASLAKDGAERAMHDHLQSNHIGGRR